MLFIFYFYFFLIQGSKNLTSTCPSAEQLSNLLALISPSLLLLIFLPGRKIQLSCGMTGQQFFRALQSAWLLKGWIMLCNKFYNKIFCNGTQLQVDYPPPPPRPQALNFPVPICNGNRTEWSPIQSVIIRVITKSDDRAAGVRFVYYEYDYRLNWTTRSPIIN